MNYFRKGFTLVELLLVVAIIGIMAFVVGPSIFTSSDLMRLKTASRGVVQLSRYSKTMALLHQEPVDLVFSSNGKISVQKGSSGGDSLVSASSFSRTNIVDESEAESEEIEAPEISEEKIGGSSGGEGYVMADLEIEKEYEQVIFRFDGYTDTIDGVSDPDESFSVSSFSGSEEDEEEVKSFKIHYKSNGTCRPHRIRILVGEDGLEYRIVDVNMLGAAKVVEEDEW